MSSNEKLAQSLERLKKLQDEGKVGLRADELSRVHRERLIRAGFIKEVVKGWYIISPQDEQPGDSTSWYISFWGFVARYLKDRYGQHYCLSAEQSLLLHSKNTSVPGQLLVRSPFGNNRPTQLMFKTSLFMLKGSLPSDDEVDEWNGLRIFSLAASITDINPSFYLKRPTDIRAALMMISDSSEILEPLLIGGHTVLAGRLAGAFRNMGQDKIADEIVIAMRMADYDVREKDPFQAPPPVTFRERSPYVNRLRLMWHQMRPVVLKHFPDIPGIPQDREAFLKQIEALYTTDAYHSLSIEKYTVTPELIERVRSGKWDHQNNANDQRARDAMAARGYWQAFNKVKASIIHVLDGGNPGEVANQDHGGWYRELFAPGVQAGLLKPSDLAGYRNHQVYIGQSKHTPVDKVGVRDSMPVLFELIQEEEHPAVRAVLGHFLLVYIHPYMDGNGRMGRFLMNLMLISGGYPWTVIPVEQRWEYMEALESASTLNDIEPFCQFMSWLVESGLKGNPVAQITWANLSFPD